MLALQQLQPMADAISSVEAPRRFNTDLITTFAVGALLMAITGIYAVVAFSVSLRTRNWRSASRWGAAHRYCKARIDFGCEADTSRVCPRCARLVSRFTTCQLISL